MAQTDSGQKLGIGQRLVTRDGYLRRWDGFTATTPAAGDLAEQLLRRNRLSELGALIEADEAEIGSLEAQDTAIGEKRERIDVAIAEAREGIRAAEDAGREARREKDRAEGRIERSEVLAADLQARLDANTASNREAEAASAAARSALSQLPDDGRLRERTAELERWGEAMRDQLRARQAALSTLDQSIAATRERRAGLQADIRAHEGRRSEAEERQTSLAERRKTTARALKEIAGRPGALDEEIASLARTRETATDALALHATRFDEAGEGLKSVESELAEAEEALSVARETRAGASARADNEESRQTEMVRIASERFSCAPQDLANGHDFEPSDERPAAEASAGLEKLQAARERIGPVNLVADSELEDLDQEISTGRAEAEELSQAIHRLRGSIGSLNREGRQRLLAAFEAVNGHFQRLFTTLFEGGAAHLELIESDDPLEAGLEIMAQPPGKKLSALTLLSGGEQALTAIALIFGLFLTNPAPICVLDEVDAPLDDANIERFCDLLERMTRETETRYLIVTHNAVTMSRMDRLFGVTMMEHGVSRLVSVDLDTAEQLLAAE